MLLEFFEKWGSIIKKEIMLNLYETSLIPKIFLAVDFWDPMLDTVPIHLWLHPWLPVLGINSLAPAISNVAEKMTAALRNWSPADESAKILLAPWKPVLHHSYHRS